MTLNLSRYQASKPYPQVRKASPDPELAATLMEAYTGASSELTTVLQYSYHSLQCKREYEDISQVMRGIFYVETLHLELLGSCIVKLGSDPMYTPNLQGKPVFWQSSLVEYDSSAQAMLYSDLEGEKGAASFYEELAQKTEQEDISRLLGRLAEDEKLHVRILEDLYQTYFVKK